MHLSPVWSQSDTPRETSRYPAIKVGLPLRLPPGRGRTKERAQEKIEKERYNLGWARCTLLSLHNLPHPSSGGAIVNTHPTSRKPGPQSPSHAQTYFGLRVVPPARLTDPLPHVPSLRCSALPGGTGAVARRCRPNSTRLPQSCGPSRKARIRSQRVATKTDNIVRAAEPPARCLAPFKFACFWGAVSALFLQVAVDPLRLCLRDTSGHKAGLVSRRMFLAPSRRGSVSHVRGAF